LIDDTVNQSKMEEEGSKLERMMELDQLKNRFNQLKDKERMEDFGSFRLPCSDTM